MSVQIVYKDLFQKTYTEGVTVADVVVDLQQYSETTIMALKAEDKLYELGKQLKTGSYTMEIVDLETADGARIYQRSLAFVFIRAIKELYDGAEVNILHSLSKGLYCEIKLNNKLIKGDAEKIKQKMQAIIDLDEAFEKSSVPIKKAVAIFAEQGMEEKVKLMRYRRDGLVNLYKLGWLYNYFYGYMFDRAGKIDKFDLIPFDCGFILMSPTVYTKGEVPEFEAQPKLAEVHREAERWGDILGAGYIHNINDAILNGTMKELILISEGLHEKKIAQIADQITDSGKRIILIAGPSSSGKTTFANRLKIQLRVNGLEPVTMGTDDYFVGREQTPLDEHGNYDFESIDALDLERFNSDLLGLLKGEKVTLPIFNFQTGSRESIGKDMQIGLHQPIIIEGIHALNPKLTEKISADDKFKIYISCLTQLNLDNHNRIPTTDSRLIRRMVRDFHFRGHSVSDTIAMWYSVRRGEERNIFPYQETADAMFNSAMVHELAVLKKYVEPQLLAVSKDAPEYPEANRLLKFLRYVISIPDDSIVPNTSIVKEFIGGSVFSH